VGCLRFWFVAGVLGAALAGCGGSGHAKKVALRSRPLAPVIKTTGCQARRAVPDRACTPGAVVVGLTIARLCGASYVKNARHVTLQGQREVYAAYGVPLRSPSHKLDHLVPRGLGGSNLKANLWPAPTRAPGFFEKGALANFLHDQVCARHLQLARAQQEVASDWLAAYRSVGARRLARYRSRTQR
jgi:hypothetical protein